MPYKDPEKQRKASARYYAANREKYLESFKELRAKRKATIRSLKERPCADCNEEYPYYVMQFDHISDKSFGISAAMKNKSLQRLLDEIEKCEVVCANCHAIRTWQRGQRYG